MNLRVNSNSSDDIDYELNMRERRKFKCTTCRKPFSSKHCLIEHKYKHSNIKPYKCEICQVRFRHASQFSIHKQEHKIPQMFYWPNLEDLEKIDRSHHRLEEEIENEKIEIPLITWPKTQKLPPFQEIVVIPSDKIFNNH